MSEKKLYTDVTVTKGTLPTATPTQRAYRGISTVNNDNQKFGLYDVGLIKQDLINHFHISQGEKLENPTFGTIIWDVLFEPLTEQMKDLIIQNITRVISSDPRVSVNNVTVDQYESGLQVECSLIYRPYNISETMRLQFDENAGFIAS